MKLRFLYGILLAIAIIQAEGAGSTGNVADNPDLGIVTENRGSEGRSLNEEGDHSIDEELNQTFENDDLREEELNIDNNSTSTVPTSITNEPSTPNEISPSTSNEISSSTSNEISPSTSNEISSSTSNEISSSTSNVISSSTSNVISSSTSNVISSSTSNVISSSTSNVISSSTSNEISSTIASPTEYPYQVKGKNGTCILSKMKISLTLTYINSKNQESEKILNVPSSNVTTTGECDETNSTMELTWSSEETISEYKSINFASDGKNTITFYFKKSNSVFSIDQIKASIYLDQKNFPDALLPGNLITLETKENLSLFATSTNDRYVCNVAVFVTEKNFEFLITDVNLIAFNTDNDISSKSVNYCVNPLTETANVGAIVGGVIGALAVIGIMGFVIWRRRRNAPVRSEVP
ncbi:hypothetical protein HZH68_014141 [Vespula germanica]|uniref:Lysosome-associated membrane glycoprotein 5 n=1 Tax=Vespula germanica TaxID=30212 RepID=A0A834MUV6_VESGE|nr:hypothetical protein HZH68_014141 [Vespula germanica]